MIKLNELYQPLEVLEVATKVLGSGRYIKGPLVEEFEEAWAKRCGMKYAIGVSSGSTALELAMQATWDLHSVLPITYTQHTFKAVPNAINRVCNIPVPVPNIAQPVVYAHHLHDQRPSYIPMIEDCSHAHGYSPVAETAIFSFFPTKILGACGDAGIVVTNSRYVAKTIRELRNHGEPDGTNARMDEIQAAILLAKLPYLDKWIKRRQEIVDLYDKGLKRRTAGKFHYAYCIEGSESKKRELISMGIESAFYYTSKYMALPLHPYLTNQEVERVIECVLRLQD